MRAIFALLVLILFPAQLAAHEMRPAIATADLRADGSFDLVISLNLEAIMAGVGPEHADTKDSPQALEYDGLRALPPEELRDRFSAFAPRLESEISLSPAAGPQTKLTTTGLSIPPVGDLETSRISEITLRGLLPPNTDTVRWSFDPVFGDSVIRLRRAGETDLFHSQYVSGPASSPISLVPGVERSVASVFAEYLRLGFIHIIPRGLDHILFVVGLFLLSTRPSVLLWQVSAFTVAHTITLALGSLGIVQLSPAIVEPLIALSIVYVAVENLMATRLSAWRPVVIFGFGLLHGLGFASVLGEVGLTTGHFVTGLVAFNIGVELGQLSVIAACLLGVGWAMQRPIYRQAVIIPGSTAIALIAAYWAVERTFA
ncbi:MAG: HupE/UreJ family protein [Pseudotabrizicola sp.]|uniref:HupE/UreJ family protein n=1 Tax=Pseudotabrizicola sp. TaxID=2939647 RepID=UPI00272F9C44|nr:HupE/UreJ family protein [Pseudotabrizicola sp.]MDP2081594.1 HupE/UreJ family protein [Pseudotabrizicola sp.]MDZ7576410.1 HupE/UreJ family protein [Pseudotabrizicola sp.]